MTQKNNFIEIEKEKFPINATMRSADLDIVSRLLCHVGEVRRPQDHSFVNVVVDGSVRYQGLAQCAQAGNGEVRTATYDTCGYGLEKLETIFY